eukprot:55738-Rhodomonas_salina.1
MNSLTCGFPSWYPTLPYPTTPTLPYPTTPTLRYKPPYPTIQTNHPTLPYFKPRFGLTKFYNKCKRTDTYTDGRTDATITLSGLLHLDGKDKYHIAVFPLPCPTFSPGAKNSHREAAT